MKPKKKPVKQVELYFYKFNASKQNFKYGELYLK